MEIECLWHKHPGWFLEQPKHVRNDLIAHFRVRNNPNKKVKSKRVNVQNDSAASFWGV